MAGFRGWVLELDWADATRKKSSDFLSPAREKTDVTECLQMR